MLERFEKHKMPFVPHNTCCISLDPVTYTEGGSLLDDVDVQFISLQFVTWDYGKSDQKAAPFLKIDMLPSGASDIHTEYSRCGDLEQWAPSADGETLVPQSAKAKENASIAKSCNAAMFLSSLVTAGVPSSKLASERISDLVGIRCHVLRKKVDRANLKRDAGARDQQVLTVSKILSLPWDASPTAQVAPRATAAAHAASNPTPAPQAPAGSNGGVFTDADLAALAVACLLEGGGSLPKIQLMTKVFKAAAAGSVPLDAKDPDGKPARSTAAQRVTNEQFLMSQAHWRYDGNNITLI